MGFYSLSAAALFALVIPTVALYFLKLKRPRQVIPSLALWQAVLADSRVNSPFQKFKRNILLLLQLLLLCLLILAAMQPYWRGGDSAGDRVLVLLDRSASMDAKDAAGKSRLEVAKDRVRKIIDELNFNAEISLIAFSKSSRQVAPFTSNKRILREALESIAIEDVPGELTDALRMADATARTTSLSHVLLLTDGVLPPKVDFDLPFKLDYQKLEPAGQNLGITALSARRAPGESWRVFVKVEGTRDPQSKQLPDSTATLEFIQDGQARPAENIVLTNEGEQRFVFTLDTAEKTTIELRLKCDGFDSLASDNIAFMDLAPPRPLTVYVSPGLQSYRHALQAMVETAPQSLRIFPESEAGVPPGRYDLMITDGAETVTAEAQTRLYVGWLPDEIRPLVEMVQESSAVVDWRRDATLLEHVEMSELVTLDQAKWLAEDSESQLENLHYEVLVYGQKGPMILQRQGRATEYYSLVHTDRSTLPYRVGFPILVSNLVRGAMQDAGLLEVRGNRTGVLPPLQMVVGQTYSIQAPDGGGQESKADDAGVLSAVSALHIGRYSVKQGGDEKASVGVSLLDRDESLMVSTEKLEMSELSVAAAAPRGGNRALWLVLAWMALAMLLVEWWFFQRRPGGYR